MKLIIIAFVLLFIPLTSGMGQSVKREQTATKQTTTPNEREICIVFVVERVETKWTDLGLASSLHGHMVRKKDCIETRIPPARKISARTKSF
jgi:hypothetical protein